MSDEIQCRYFVVGEDDKLKQFLAPYTERMDKFRELDRKNAEEFGSHSVAINNYRGVTGWYFDVTPNKEVPSIPDGLREYSKYSSDYSCEDGTKLKIYIPANRKFKASKPYYAYLKELNDLYCDIPQHVTEYFDAHVQFFVANLNVARTVAVHVGDYWLFMVPWPEGNNCQKVFDSRLKEIKKSQYVAVLEEGVDPNEL